MKTRILLLLTLLTLTSLTMKGDLITFQNGSFESGLSNWVTNNSSIVNNPFPGVIIPSDGTNCVEFGLGDVAGSVLSQSFFLSDGTGYILSFDVLAQGDAGNVGILRVNVSSSNTVLFSQMFTNPAQTGPPFSFTSRTNTFSVPVGITNVTISFADFSPNGGSAVDPVLDNVRIGFANPAPLVTSQPQSKTVAVGATVNFSVGASGSQPLRYQWRFGNVELVGKTNSTLIISNVQPSDGGNYSVLITNTISSVTSSNALLTVLASVVITSSPQGQSIRVGSNVTFSVSAAGDGPLSYQWKFNGSTNIGGATNSTFTINNVQLTNAGTYSVVVSNSVSSATSSNAPLFVITPAGTANLQNGSFESGLANWSTTHSLE